MVLLLLRRLRSKQQGSRLSGRSLATQARKAVSALLIDCATSTLRKKHFAESPMNPAGILPLYILIRHRVLPGNFAALLPHGHVALYLMG